MIPYFRNNQKILLELANSGEGKDLLYELSRKRPDNKIVRVTQNSFIENLEGRLFRGVFFSRHPIFKKFVPVVEDYKLRTEPYYPSRFARYVTSPATYNSAAGANSPVDGNANRGTGGEAFGTLRAGAGNAHSSVAANGFSPYLDFNGTTFGTMVRGFHLFDTSTLTTRATVTVAVFSYYVTSTLDTFPSGQSTGIVACTIASNSAVADSDYDGTVGNVTRYATDKTIASQTTSAYADFNFNATGIAAVSKTAITYLGTKVAPDIDNSAPTTAGASYAAGVQINFADNGSNEPKLVVTFTLPPASKIYLKYRPRNRYDFSPVSLG